MDHPNMPLRMPRRVTETVAMAGQPRQLAQTKPRGQAPASH